MLTQWLTKAGSFDVEHVGGIPHFPQSVLLDAPRTGVIHTTEGATIEGAMGVFRQHYAPHFTLGKDASGKVHIYQLVPIGYIGAALVSNNDHAIVQVEVVGFSKETIWIPDPETLAALAALMATCQVEYGIPLSHPWADGDFGRAGDNPHRHAGKWGVIAGWYGHGDVPSIPGHSEETHWDPGALQWSEVFKAAGAVPQPTPTPTPPVPPRPCPPPPIDLTTVGGLQQALNKLGAQPPLIVDGDFGAGTLAALRPIIERALAA